MKNLKAKKITKRQYLFLYIDMCLVTFLFIFICQILFMPYGTSNLKDIRFYLCLLNAVGFSVWLHWYHIKLIIRLINKKEPYPEGLEENRPWLW